MAMGLHGNVSIEMVQSTVGFFAAIPPTLIHALDFFVATARSLVLLGAGNRNERVNLFSKAKCQREKLSWGANWRL